MAHFQTKIPKLGTFWRVLQWKMLSYFMAIWSILPIAIWYVLWQLGKFHGYLVYSLPFWYRCTKKNLATQAEGRLSILEV
jgi:hypothetical protein